MKKLTSGQYKNTLFNSETYKDIVWSRLDMSEKEINEEILDCYNNDYSLDQTAEVFRELIADHNDDYEDYDY